MGIGKLPIKVIPIGLVNKNKMKKKKKFLMYYMYNN